MRCQVSTLCEDYLDNIRCRQLNFKGFKIGIRNKIGKTLKQVCDKIVKDSGYRFELII